MTGHAVASSAAALIFGTSPFVSAHLLGHFNLIAAWTLPLVSLSMLSVLDRPTTVRGLLVGLALAATAYTDYYLFVFAVGIVFLLWLSHIVAIRGDIAPSPSIAGAQRRVRRILFSVLVIDVVVIAAIALFPGDRLDIRTIHISLRSVSNPITFGWILLVIIAMTFVSGRVRLQIDAANDTSWTRTRRCGCHNRDGADAPIDSGGAFMARRELCVAGVSLAKRTFWHRCGDTGGWASVSCCVGRFRPSPLRTAPHRRHRILRLDPGQRDRARRCCLCVQTSESETHSLGGDLNRVYDVESWTVVDGLWPSVADHSPRGIPGFCRSSRTHASPHGQ